MILAQADHDERLRQRLLTRTAMAATAGAGAGEIRRAIDQAVRVHGFVEYGGAYDYARGIHDTVDLVEGLLRDGHSVAVIELCEHALRRVERAIESVDDSDGELGGLLERLQELHLAACRAAKPDPEALAARLFAWELTSEWDVFHGVAETYGDVLGVVRIYLWEGELEPAWQEAGALGCRSTSGRSTHFWRRSAMMGTRRPPSSSGASAR